MESNILDLGDIYEWFLQNRIPGRPYAYTSAKKDVKLHHRLATELGGGFSTIDLFRFLQPTRSRCLACQSMLKCSNPQKEFNFEKGFRVAYCSKLCAASAPEVRAKVAATHMKIRGVDHISKDPSVVAKRAETLVSRYGGHTFQSEKLRDKASATMESRYGVRNYSKTLDWRSKSMETSIKRIGVPFWTQDAVSAEKAKKNAFQYKEVVINGESHMVQGYEPQALKYLERDAISVTTTKDNLPRLMYIYGGVMRRYYPDALIHTHSQGTILLEVKSTYTIRVQVDKLVEKFKSANAWCLESGAKFCVMVVEAGGAVHEFFPKNEQELRDISKRFGNKE